MEGVEGRTAQHALLARQLFHFVGADIDAEEVRVRAVKGDHVDGAPPGIPPVAPHVQVRIRNQLPRLSGGDIVVIEVPLVEFPCLEVRRHEGDRAAVGRPAQLRLRRVVVGDLHLFATRDGQQHDFGQVPGIPTILAPVRIGQEVAVGRWREVPDAAGLRGQPGRVVGSVAQLYHHLPDPVPGSPGLAVGPLVDEDCVVSVLPFLLYAIRQRVAGQEEDRPTVPRPAVGAYRRHMPGELYGLAAVNREDEQLPYLVAVAGRTRERHPPPVGGPFGAAVVGRARKGPCILPVGPDDPYPAHSLVLVPVQFVPDEEDAGSIRRESGPRDPHHVDRVVKGEGLLATVLGGQPSGAQSGEKGCQRNEWAVHAHCSCSIEKPSVADSQ